MVGAHWGQGWAGEEPRWLAGGPAPDRGGAVDLRWGRVGEGIAGGWPLALPVDRASSLDVVGIIVTGCSGCYDVLVAGFLYI